jgi:3-methyladenine DNA glycosylase Tag
MNQDMATRMFDEAKLYCETNHPDELEWANSINAETFRNLKSKRFLTEYCWVIYASGFKVSTVEAIFPDLQKSFKEFDIRSLSKMRSIEPTLRVFNNERKANSFLNGSKAISTEGFSAFKKRLKKEGVDMLEQLPGIGPITKYHLAKNIGLVDEAKPDIWLVRAAEASNTSVDELVRFLSEKYSMSRHSVDVVLWRYGADNGLGL